MIKIENLLLKTLEEIKPTKKEIEQINHIVKEFSSFLKEENIRFIYGGSYAKGTFLKNLEDVDIYLLMKSEEELEILKEKIKKIAEKKRLDLKVLHGSRDYFQIRFKNKIFELVPILDINRPEEMKNSTDLSKFHVEYVKKKIRENPKIRDEILLFKYFLKQKNLYGAESYNKGFSGYLSEVLVIYFGSFLKTLEFFSRARPIVFIPKIEKKFFIELKKSGKINEYFNVLDPVYEKRNLGMAVSREKFFSLILESKLFLKNPNFDKKDEKKEVFEFFKSLPNNYILLELKFNNKLNELYQNPDVIGSKMKKIGEKVIKKLSEFFEIYHYIFSFDKKESKGEFLIILNENPKIVVKEGPPVFVDNVYDFLEKNKDALFVLKDRRIYALLVTDVKIKEILNKMEEKEYFNFEIRKKVIE